VIITEERPALSESAELLAQARAGEAVAYCALAQACDQRLFQQAVALCHNLTAAEDLVAETLFEAWRSLKRFDGTCRFSTWLYAILIHRFQKSLRRARSRPVPLASLPVREAEEREILLERLSDAGPWPAEALLQKELTARLREAIHALPRKHQQVVLLRFYEEASLPEIAGALGLSIGTVKSRLHHALDKLRKMKSIVNLSDRTRDT
jgi:RNA polymerase sigma-70 factor (ECF subfamily)